MPRTKAAPPASGAPADIGQQVQGTAAFSKFMLVLQTIANAPGELDIGRLAKLLPYPRGTLYRIVGALISEDMIRENTLTGTYQLGHRLMSLASKSWEAFDLRTLAHDHIAALRDATGETVHLAVPSGQEMVYIDKLESPRSVRMTSRIGTRVSLHSTSVGKAYLAALQPAERDKLLGSIELVARTPHTITRALDLKAEILETERRSYSTDREENELEIRCFGAAIRDRDGTPVGCVSVSIPKYRFKESDSGTFVAELLARVQAISRSLRPQL